MLGFVGIDRFVAEALQQVERLQALLAHEFGQEPAVVKVSERVAQRELAKLPLEHGSMFQGSMDPDRHRDESRDGNEHESRELEPELRARLQHQEQEVRAEIREHVEEVDPEAPGHGRKREGVDDDLDHSEHDGMDHVQMGVGENVDRREARAGAPSHP